MTLQTDGRTDGSGGGGGGGESITISPRFSLLFSSKSAGIINNQASLI